MWRCHEQRRKCSHEFIDFDIKKSKGAGYVLKLSELVNVITLKIQDMGILVLTIANKIRKGKTIFFLNNIEKCFTFLYYSIFYIAAKNVFRNWQNQKY